MRRWRRIHGMKRTILSASAAAAVLPFGISIAFAAGPSCRVVDGMVADLALGPYLPATETVTLHSSNKVEFRWELSDKESTGWMRISDASGVELGWVPAGHEAVTCGKSN